MTDHLQPDHSCDVCKPLRPVNSGLFGGGPVLGRRDFFKIAGTGVAGSFVVPMFAKEAKADDTAVGAELYGRARNLIYIHMQGAPSHVDTFDLKVGSWTPADFTPEVLGNGVLFPERTDANSCFPNPVHLHHSQRSRPGAGAWAATDLDANCSQPYVIDGQNRAKHLRGGRPRV